MDTPTCSCVVSPEMQDFILRGVQEFKAQKPAAQVDEQGVAREPKPIRLHWPEGTRDQGLGLMAYEFWKRMVPCRVLRCGQDSGGNPVGAEGGEQDQDRGILGFDKHPDPLPVVGASETDLFRIQDS